MLSVAQPTGRSSRQVASWLIGLQARLLALGSLIPWESSGSLSRRLAVSSDP